MARFKPLADKILTVRMETETLSKGGIYIPDSAQERPAQARVVSVGPGRLQPDNTIRPLAVKEGDHVLFTKYGGIEIKIDGVDYLILSENDIYGVIEPVEVEDAVVI